MFTGGNASDDTVEIHTDINIDSLISQLVDHLPEYKLMEIIKDIDRLVEDYSFTEELANYFKNEILKEDRSELISTLKEEYKNHEETNHSELNKYILKNMVI